MGKVIYLGIFLASLYPEYREASDMARRGLLETPMMKEEIKDLKEDSERRVYLYTGLTKDDFTYAVYAYPLIAGKISTKPINNFKLESKDHWVLRPELEYNLWTKEPHVGFFLNKEF